MKNNNQFEHNLQAVRNISLTPEEKGKMFKTLLHYAETHQPVKTTFIQSLVRFVRGLATYKTDSR